MANHKNVEIGFLEKKESWLLHPRFFPSKVGGLPAWLNLRDLASPESLQCSRCKDPMVFLCQVYAPYEDKEDCFHRTIYVFICRNGNCCRPNSSENLAVFRSQLARNNDFYSNEPSAENKDERFCMKKWTKLCVVCGGKAPSHCSKCKEVYYCSRNHQILHWKKGHKENCGNDVDKINTINEQFAVTVVGKTLLFEEWELAIEEEDEEEKNEVNVDNEIKKMQKLLKEKSVTLNNVNDDEMEKYVNPVAEDKVFNKFNKRVARHPDQILRYDRGGKPLWITSFSDERLEIPQCPYCNKDRQFEFQIMPQLLNYVNVGLDFNSIDWGVLAVYTCKDSCSGGPAYKREHLIKQDLTTDPGENIKL